MEDKHIVLAYELEYYWNGGDEERGVGMRELLLATKPNMMVIFL